MVVLSRSGFDDDEIAYSYRAFGAFLLGSSLLETRATDAVETDQRCPPVDRSPLPSVAGHHHDDDFPADLDDVINRIAYRTCGQRLPHRGTDVASNHHCHA